MNLQPINRQATTISGAIGIVVIPDQKTQERSRTLAKELLGEKAEYCLSNADLPHLTLYHGKLVDAPCATLQSARDSISKLIIGQTYTLYALGFAGANFLFWDVDFSSDKGALRKSHDLALGLSNFLNRATTAKATSEENLKLSPRELDNIARYGHPFVGDLFRPHITLGFGPALESNAPLRVTSVRHDFTVSDIAVAQIGYPGRIEKLVDLSNSTRKA